MFGGNWKIHYLNCSENLRINTFVKPNQTIYFKYAQFIGYILKGPTTNTIFWREDTINYFLLQAPPNFCLISKVIKLSAVASCLNGDILQMCYTTQLLLLLSHFSCVRLCATPYTAAHQAPPSLGFSRQEHWSGLPFPSPMHESAKWNVKVKSLSHVRLYATPYTAAHQAPPSLGFSRQEHWSGVPLPSPGPCSVNH